MNLMQSDKIVLQVYVRVHVVSLAQMEYQSVRKICMRFVSPLYREHYLVEKQGGRDHVYINHSHFI